LQTRPIQLDGIQDRSKALGKTKQNKTKQNKTIQIANDLDADLQKKIRSRIFHRIEYRRRWYSSNNNKSTFAPNKEIV